MSNDPAAQIKALVLLAIVEELRRRAGLGHTAGCLCQSRPGLSCQALRKVVGWQMVREVFGE